MNTLREIMTFVAMIGEQSMGFVKVLVPPLTGIQQTSMQAMILALESLPPITLTANFAEGDHTGPIPYSPEIHIEPSGGVVTETFVSIPPLQIPVPVGPYGNYRPVTINTSGDSLVHVGRRGITSTGVTVNGLDLNFNGFPVHVIPTPPHPPPRTPPSSPEPTCNVEAAPDQPLQFSTETRIFGNGFVSPELVDIFIDDALATSTATDATGAYDVTISVPKGNHSAQARGEVSKRASKRFTYNVDA